MHACYHAKKCLPDNTHALTDGWFGISEKPPFLYLYPVRNVILGLTYQKHRLCSSICTTPYRCVCFVYLGRYVPALDDLTLEPTTGPCTLTSGLYTTEAPFDGRQMAQCDLGGGTLTLPLAPIPGGMVQMALEWWVQAWLEKHQDYQLNS